MKLDQQDLLPPAETDNKRLPSPGGIVIDNETQTITFETKSPALLLAEADRNYGLVIELKIDSDFMYQEGADLLQTIVGAKKTLDEDRLASTKPLREEAQKINDGYKPVIQKYEDGEKLLKGMLTKYADDKEKERQRLQRIENERIERERRETERLAKEAREKAEREAAEATRLANEEAAARTLAASQQAEQLRLEAEQAEASGDLSKAGDLLEKADQTVATAETTANMILAHGEESANDALLRGAEEADSHTLSAQMMTAPAVQVARPRAAGVSMSKTYTAVVTDRKALLEYIVANYELLSHFVEIDQGALNRYARDQKERMKLPGVELSVDTNMSSRRKAA